MRHDIPRLRRNFCRAMRRGGKIVYVTLEDLAELLTVYAEREIERSLQGQPIPPVDEKVIPMRARRPERTQHVRND